MTAQELYERRRKLGLTDDITSNESPDYELPFYQSIFKLMEAFLQIKTKIMSENIEDAAKEYAEINEDKAANSAHSYSKYDIADAYQQGYNLAVSRLKKEFNKNKNKMKTVKFNLRMKGETAEADINGSAEGLVELIATIMVENDICARLIIAATDVYNLEKSKDNE